MKMRASSLLGSALVLASSVALAQTPPPGYEPPPGYQPQQQYPQQQYPQQQYPQQQYPQQQYPQQQYPQQQYPQQQYPQQQYPQQQYPQQQYPQAAPAPGYYQQPAPGYAPPAPMPVRQPRRLGFFFGGSLGLGKMFASAEGSSSSNDLGGFGLELHGGFMILPRLGILVEGSALIGAEDFTDGYGNVYTATIAHSAGILGAQLWLTDMLWVRGGFGGGSYEISDDLATTSWSGASFMVAGGVDLVRSPNFTVDLHGRWLITAFDGFSVNNLALHVGLNWYSVIF